MKDVSRLLSAALRHKPEILGIELDENGWTDVTILLDKLRTEKKIKLSTNQLSFLIENNDKKRFALSEDGSKIRASQGHSVPVDLELKRQKPPSFLYHGTVNKAVNKIIKSGMKKMSRHAIHLSVDTETATQVGSRRGKPILLKIFAGAMHMDGFKFYKSANGVWLTDVVPPKYIKEL
jgi:putative RNA 2'-phosphotransferase